MGSGKTDPAQRGLAEGGPGAALVSTLEDEIVPRLLLLSRLPTDSAECSTAPDPGDVAELTRLLLAHGPDMAFEYAEALRHRGVPLDRICIDLFVGAAHELAEQCERRNLSHPQLMQGLGALQSVVKRYQ